MERQAFNSARKEEKYILDSLAEALRAEALRTQALTLDTIAEIPECGLTATESAQLERIAWHITTEAKELDSLSNQ